MHILINRVRDDNSCPAHFSKDLMYSMRNAVVGLLAEKVPDLLPENLATVKLDYCTYVKGECSIKHCGVTWEKDGKILSAKGDFKALKDLYQIFPGHEVASAELSWDTLDIIAKYHEQGFTKTDLNGNVLQRSLLIRSHTDLPVDFIARCKEVGFPWYVHAYGYSVKPYGEVIEFSLPEWVNAFYN